MDYALLVLRINYREDTALEIQKILTAHGCKIMTRLGLHDHGSATCSPCGTIILQLSCSSEERKAVEADILKIGGVKARFVDFD
ncbi:MAG: hypothetical protein LBG29_02770 [Synergistaceae bacterium]|jgi:hypothetical protein|nr:hypothetical protein [Synergistaceae bacterium]